MPELPDLPPLAPTALTGLRLAPRLPMTKAALGQELSMSGGRAEDVAKHMQAIKIAFAETKAQNKYQKAKAKAQDRQMQKWAER